MKESGMTKALFSPFFLIQKARLEDWWLDWQLAQLTEVSGSNFSAVMQMYVSFVDVSFASGIVCSLQYPPLKRKCRLDVSYNKKMTESLCF